METATKLNKKVLLKTQCIIFVIGVCASLAFYTMARINVDITLHQWTEKRQSSAQALIKEEFSNLDREIKSLVKHVEHSSIHNIVENLQNRESGKSVPSVFWLDARSLSLDNSPSILPLQGANQKRDHEWYLSQENINILKTYYKTFSKKDLGVVKSISVKPMVQNVTQNDWSQSAGAFMLATLLRLTDDNVGVLVAIIEPHKTFNQFYLYESLGLSSLKIQESGRDDYLLDTTHHSIIDTREYAEKPNIYAYTCLLYTSPSPRDA